MNGFKRSFFLVALFLVCFLLAAFLSRNVFSPESSELAAQNSQASNANYVPEKYELETNPIIEEKDINILQRLDDERTNLIQRVTKSVVCISTEGLQKRRLMGQWGITNEFLTSVKDVGSGVIVSKQGHIVTNHHVIAAKQKFIVALEDGSEFSAEVIGTDPILDIAVLKVESDREDFLPMPFGDSDQVRVGQTVFAVGNPYGLGETVTQGIISAKERSFSDRQRDLFQSDAAINPGNSGGPLVNVRGEIIGINVAIFNSDDSVRESQGVGFSIPSNEVLRTFKQIAERGRPTHGYLGVKLMDLTPEIKVVLGYDAKGVAVTEITKESPAEKSGMLPRDIIVKYNEKEVENRSHLIRLIQNSPLDEDIKIVISREGDRVEITARIIDTMDLDEQSPKQTIKDGQYNQVMGRLASIGLKVRELEWIEQRQGGFQGVMISAIQPNSMGAKTGLRKGDRVVSMNDEYLYSAEQFYQYIADAKAGESMSMVVQRNNQRVQVKFRMN